MLRFANVLNDVGVSEKLKNICQLYGYCEIEPEREAIKWLNESTLGKAYEILEGGSFKCARIRTPGDVWPACKKFFGGNS